jgi:hypothetical protein
MTMSDHTIARTCQFHGGRTGADGFLVFCGKPVRPGSSYCPEHYRRIYKSVPGLIGARDAAAANDDAPVEESPARELEAA